MLSDYTHFRNQAVELPHPLSARVLDWGLRLLHLKCHERERNIFCNRSFSHDATAAKLVYQNNELKFLINLIFNLSLSGLLYRFHCEQ